MKVARWAPTASMMLVSLISYIDRNTLALLAPTILRETRLSGEQYGFIISAFSVAYMVGNPVWGMLLDRVGLRRGMTAAVALWTLASAAHAFAGGLFSFGAARALLGFGEGATFPGGLRTAVQTLPESSRSRGIAVAYSGGSLGAIVTPIIVTPLAAAYGWRAAFAFTGVIGLAWIAVWAVVSRGIPAKQDLQITDGAPAPKISNPKIWAFMSAYALGALPLAFVIYGAPLYLSKVRGTSQTGLGALLWIPPLGWEAGYFFWGWISDRFRRGGQVSFNSLFLLLMVLSLPLAILARAGALPLLLFGLFFAMFVAAGFVILSIAYATEVFSAEHSGLIAGLGAGSWSAVIAVAMPLVGRLFDQQRYDAAFGIAAIFPISGYVLWRAFSR